ncbi:MAG: hypothetical protein PHQ96_07660 [Candidatus Omnitrophica bacterium]|nr:hypothetical protein [Candidatus Omnitrophota bacterium]
MNLQFAFLCESANLSASNLFNVLGGGIGVIFFNALPQTRHLTLLLRLEYNPVMETGEHGIQIRLLDNDGLDKISSISLRLEFRKGERFFNFITGLAAKFDSFGEHSVEISVDGHSVISIPLNIMAQKG